MAGVTFGQLPDEVPAFLAFLQKTGDVWARAVDDRPHKPKYEPLPVADFLERYANQISTNSCVMLYLGFRNDIFNPAVWEHDITEGGTEIPFIQDGKVVEGVHTIVGGKKVRRKFIDLNGSPYIRYDRGEFRSKRELSASNLGYGSGTFIGEQWVPQPQAFLKWGKKVLGWMRRHTPEMVPVYQCNYEMRATPAVAEASRNGLKLR